MTAIWFVLLAAIATLIRAVVTAGQPDHAMPWGTLAVNTFGAALLGLIVEANWWDNPVAMTVAGLGSLTTFSTVAGEAADFVDDGRWDAAVVYVGLTLAAGIAAAWFGLLIGRVL